jgi:rod shape-determining protein MreC
MLRVTDDYDGVLSGTTNYDLLGELYDPQAKVSVGDYIVTSGLGIYPKGILIGKIYEVVENKDLILNRIKVTPAVDFKRINKVMVIPYSEIESESASDTEDPFEILDEIQEDTTGGE